MDLDALINKLQSMKVTDSHEDYSQLVLLADRCRDKSLILDLLRRNGNSLDAVVPLVFTFASKLDADDDGLLVQIVELVRTCRDASREASEWIVKTLFVVLEKMGEKRRDCEARQRLQECMRMHSENTGIVNHLVSFMFAKGSGDAVASILDFIPEISDDFIRGAMQQDNPVFLKNLAAVLVQLSERQIHLFVNYQHFEEFLDSEHFFMRNCFLDICMRLAEHFRENGRMDELNGVVALVVERLSDTYFLVRYKALQVLEGLFEKSSIAIGKRAEVVAEISGRILDKTVIVRKKAVGICSSLLVNHPFATEKTLEKRSVDVKDEGRRRYYEDLNRFHNLMKNAQDSVLALLRGDTKTEVAECIEFVKLSFYYRIEGSGAAFESLFDLVWTQDREFLLASFKDLLAHAKMNGESLFGFLERFVQRQGNASFEKLLEELSGRRCIDKAFVSELCDMFFQETSLFETSYLLLHIGRPLPDNLLHQMLLQCTQALFSSRSEDDLIRGMGVYKNVVRIRTREKTEFDSEIIGLLIRNLVKMTFFEHQIVDLTVAAIYACSRVPEKSCVALLERLCSRNENSLKLVAAVGSVGLHHLQYLEELERLVKASRASVRVDTSVVTSEIRERRRSINASRQSLSRMDEVETASLEVSSKLSERTEEEIADFFFYVKEKEMLFGEKSILSMFLDALEAMCLSTDSDMQVVAHNSLYRLMCISSEFFLSHYDCFLQSLRHPNTRVRANAVVAMSDFLLSYNTVAEQHVHLLFESLGDGDSQVRQNALLVIHNLILKNVLKIKGHSTSLTFLLLDEDSRIRGMAEQLLRQVSEKEGMMATVFYEAITSENTEIASVIDFLTELTPEKTKESLFIKALRSRVDADVLERLYQAFGLSERFVSEICHFEEFRKIRLEPQTAE